MNALDLLQWPAMAVTMGAAWLVASKSQTRRRSGFWLYFVSNALWVAWGLHTDAWALILLQIGLLVMNIRGARRNDPSAS